jgi:hypothetical protein
VISGKEVGYVRRSEVTCDPIHRPAVIIGSEEVPVSVHRHLQAAMVGESLHRLGIRAGLDPA